MIESTEKILFFAGEKPIGAPIARLLIQLGNQYEKDLNDYLSDINDMNTYYETLAERSFRSELDGSCRSPISSSAYIINNDYLSLHGAVANLDGTRVIKSEIKGPKEDAVLLGQELGKEIMIKSNGETIYK